MASSAGWGFYAVLSESLRKELDPTVAGWLSVAEPTQMLTNHAVLSDTASVFEPGGRSLLSLIGFEASLRYLSSHGFDVISDTTISNVEYFVSCLELLGLTCPPKEQLAGIISLPIQGLLQGLDAVLIEKGYRFTVRQNKLRFSVYYYHSRSDIDHLISDIASFLSRSGLEDATHANHLV